MKPKRVTNRYITFSGRTQTVMEWSKELGIPANTIYNRLSKGWPAIDCLYGKAR